MLPARRYRSSIYIAELSLITCVAAGQAHAQSTTSRAGEAIVPNSGPAAAPSNSTESASPSTATSPPASASTAATTKSPSAPPANPSSNEGEPGAASVSSASEPSNGTLPSAYPNETSGIVSPASPGPADSPEPLLPNSSAIPATDGSRVDREAGPREAVNKPPESARWLLVGVGVGTTALWYAGAYGIRELWPSQADRSDLRIPVAGPFMDLAHTGCPATNPDCSTFQLVVRTILVSLDAIGQAGGVAMVLQGAILGTANVEAPRPITRHLNHRNAGLSVVPVPWIDARRGAGIGLSGRF